MHVSGFSLIELMIVVAILGILVSVALPEFKSMTDEAKTSKVKEGLKVLNDAVIRFRNNENKEPDTLQALVPKYMSALPADPWGNQFYIDPDYFLVGSSGADGIQRTLDDYKLVYDLEANKAVNQSYKTKLTEVNSGEIFIEKETDFAEYFKGNKDDYLILVFTNPYDGYSDLMFEEIFASGHIKQLINKDYFKVFIADFSKNVFMFSKYGIRTTPSIYIVDQSFSCKGSFTGYKDKADFSKKLTDILSKLE